ncbi:hypothetical protein chiPu_0022465 [Chiloscyllium punctatum]|uniref:Uncharacterized protein n=1 Tax=Chiloscyllium punctatum TaxID=137246 RepID=A0A401RG47_CHIPU|nr:hypothetical protein [Chiloscyllium punctatum]
MSPGDTGPSLQAKLFPASRPHTSQSSDCAIPSIMLQKTSLPIASSPLSTLCTVESSDDNEPKLQAPQSPDCTQPSLQTAPGSVDSPQWAQSTEHAGSVYTPRPAQSPVSTTLSLQAAPAPVFRPYPALSPDCTMHSFRSYTSDLLDAPGPFPDRASPVSKPHWLNL